MPEVLNCVNEEKKVRRKNHPEIFVYILVVILVIFTTYSIYLQSEYKPEYREEWHSGIIIAKNETRSVLYVEEELTLDSFRYWIVVVDTEEFDRFNVGDEYTWFILILIPRNIGLINSTVVVGWN